MTTPEIISMQRRIDSAGFYLVIDGEWGPKSIAACKAYLRSLMPVSNPWPYPDAASLRRFYGEPGDESKLVSVTFPYPTYYDGKLIRATRCHEKVAVSLLRILTAIGKGFGHRRDIMEEAEDYGGCFNNRNKRGGTSKSLHAYGAAIDLDADDNTFRDSWPMKSDMPLEIIEQFYREGAISGAIEWGYDSMHFQFSR